MTKKEMFNYIEKLEKELFLRIETLECAQGNLSDRVIKQSFAIGALEDCHPVDDRWRWVTKNATPLRKHSAEYATTQRAGRITLEELAQLVIDGKPITRTKQSVTTEEIKPMCCETPQGVKSDIIEATKE